MDDLLLPMPGVKGGKAFGYPAYKINGKVFCFVGGAGIAIKLPEKRVAELLAGGNANFSPFEVADGVIWKAWLSIDHDSPAAYAGDVELLEESMLYVAGQ